MTIEKGNDELLGEVADFTVVYDGVLMARYRYAVEEDKLAEITPANDAP